MAEAGTEASVLTVASCPHYDLSELQDAHEDV
jgi:hypothetical protein